jgi:signal transduction histidine kinase
MALALQHFAMAQVDSLKLRLAQSAEHQKTDILIQLSKAHWTIAPSKGMFYANEAIKLAEKYNEPAKKAKALLYGGVNAWFMGVYDDAILYYQNSLSIACQIEDKRLCAYNLNNLGMVYSYLKNYTKAIENYTKSANIIRELDDDIEYAKILNNIAELNFLLGKQDIALKQHFSVLEIIEKSDEQIFLLWIYNNIAAVYMQKEHYTLALKYLQKALDLSFHLNNTLGKAQTMNRMGNVYLKQKDFEKAGIYFFEALKFATETNAKDDMKEIYINISGYFAAINQYKKSLEYFKLHKLLSDSILSENKLKTMIEMQARYNLESKENENRLLQKNIEINELKIKKNESQRAFLLFALLMTFLLIGLIYSRLMIKKKKNTELHEKNTFINEQKNQLSATLLEQQKLYKILLKQKEEIQTAQIKLEQTNATKDKFFSIIAHDLRGPIGNISAFSGILQNNIHKYSDVELSYAIEMLKTTAQSTHALLENLLTWARSQRGEIVFSPGLFNLRDLILVCISIFELKASDKNIQVLNHCKEPVECIFDANMIKTTITNLLNNAMKYTRRNGIIEVDVKIIDNMIQVSVADNGVGMPAEVKDKLFRIDTKHFSAKGTDGESGTGLGLILCREFIEKHEGSIHAESEEAKGATFYFSIPYKT